MRHILLLLTCALTASSTFSADNKGPQVSLILSMATAEQQSSGDVQFACEVVLLNETGGPLTVKTNFGSAFDGLQVVVTNTDGKVLRQQNYIDHQSPYSVEADNSYSLKAGKTKANLIFPISEFANDDDTLKVRLVGFLPRSSFNGILSTETLKVAVK